MSSDVPSDRRRKLSIGVSGSTDPTAAHNSTVADYLGHVSDDVQLAHPPTHVHYIRPGQPLPAEVGPVFHQSWVWAGSARWVRSSGLRPRTVGWRRRREWTMAQFTAGMRFGAWELVQIIEGPGATARCGKSVEATGRCGR